MELRFFTRFMVCTFIIALIIALSGGLGFVPQAQAATAVSCSADAEYYVLSVLKQDQSDAKVTDPTVHDPKGALYSVATSAGTYSISCEKSKDGKACNCDTLSVALE